MATTPEGTPGRIQPGAGEPENRAGQDQEDATRAQAQATEDQANATEDLNKSTGKLAKVIESLGGWVKSVKERGTSKFTESVKSEITSLTTDIFSEIKDSLSQELKNLGWLEEKLSMMGVALFGYIKKSFVASDLLGFQKRKKEAEEAKEKAAAEKEARDRLTKIALDKSKGDKELFEKELSKLELELEQMQKYEKLKLQITKEEEKILKSKSEAERDEHLKKLALLNEEKLQQENNSDIVKQSTSEFTDNETSTKLEAIRNAISVNGQLTIDEIHSSSERQDRNNERRFNLAEKAAKARQNISEKAAEIRAVMTALPGWLTVAAVGGLVATAAYLVYTRWDDIVGGFKALKADLIDVKNNIVNAIENKIDKVIEFGNSLVDWANNLLPNFADWWKMTMPESFGGYNDTEKQARKDAIKQLLEKGQAANAGAIDKFIEEQNNATQQKAEVDRKNTEETAKQAEADRKKAQEIADDNQRNQQNKQSAAGNNTIVNTANNTNISGGVSANKKVAKRPNAQ